MDSRYETEISKLIRQGLGWVPKETPMRKSTMRLGKLSQEEILQLVQKDCARGADGMPVMHSGPTRIPKKIKL